MVTLTRDEALELLGALTRERQTLEDEWAYDQAYMILVDRMKQDPDAPALD